jgi:hypothetical protein
MPAILLAMRQKQAAKTNAEQRVTELSAQIEAGAQQFDRRQWLIENKPAFGLSADLFGKDTQAARQVFKQLLVSPIVMTSQVRDDGAVGFTFACEASFAGLPADRWQTWDVPTQDAGTHAGCTRQRAPTLPTTWTTGQTLSRAPCKITYSPGLYRAAVPKDGAPGRDRKPPHRRSQDRGSVGVALRRCKTRDVVARFANTAAAVGHGKMSL